MADLNEMIPQPCDSVASKRNTYFGCVQPSSWFGKGIFNPSTLSSYRLSPECLQYPRLCDLSFAACCDLLRMRILPTPPLGAGTIPGLAAQYIGSTGYSTILIAKTSPTVCPTPSVKALPSWVPDTDYKACCQEQSGAVFTATLTTARGPSGSPIYACCQKSYTCTGVAPFMSDWSVDKDGEWAYPYA